MFDVITIGTATRDVFLRSAYFKEFKDADLKKVGISSGEAECFEWGGKLEVEKPIITVGGGAANAAVTFARQGLRAASFFKVGNDRPGEGVVFELKKNKIRTFPLWDKKLGTAYSTILLSDSGERTILVYRGASSDFAVRELSLGRTNARWAYIVPGAVPLPVMKKIFAALQKKRISVAINPSGHYLKQGARKLDFALKNTSVLILNLEEAELLTGMKGVKAPDLMKGLRKMTGATIVISDGPRGVGVLQGNTGYFAKVFPERVLVDRTGAGDAFGSGFVSSLIKHPRDITRAIRLGSANATSVVEHIGAEAGILTKKDSADKRWRHLSVKTQKIL